MARLSSVSLVACDEHTDCMVVYSGRKCPLCEAEKDLEQVEQEVCDLSQEVEDLTKAKNETSQSS